MVLVRDEPIDTSLVADEIGLPREMLPSPATAVAVEALYDAADDDSATGGPDTVRQLWPVIYTVDSSGARRVPDSELAAAARNVIEARTIAGREA